MTKNGFEHLWPKKGGGGGGGLYLALNTPPVGTDAEAAGVLWVHGLWRDGYLGN
jgi:hypothetical protein